MIGEIVGVSFGAGALVTGLTVARVRLFKDCAAWMRQRRQEIGRELDHEDGFAAATSGPPLSVEDAMRAVLAETEHVVEDAARTAWREGWQ